MQRFPVPASAVSKSPFRGADVFTAALDTVIAKGYFSQMRTASVTSLKNHLSDRLKKVASGETYLITDRNRAVAILSPLKEPGSDARLQKLALDGVVRPAKGTMDINAFLEIPTGKCPASLSDAIREEREQR